MTEITDAGRKLAAELANAEGSPTPWFVCDFKYDEGMKPTAISAVKAALARLATDHLALKAEHEKAVADLREIDRIGHEHGPESPATRMVSIRAIAAKYRETDPLVEEARAIWRKALFEYGGLSAEGSESEDRAVEIIRAQLARVKP